MGVAQLKAAQQLLGHATIEMTMTYAHFGANVTRKAVLALDQGGATQVARTEPPRRKPPPASCWRRSSEWRRRESKAVQTPLNPAQPASRGVDGPV